MPRKSKAPLEAPKSPVKSPKAPAAAADEDTYQWAVIFLPTADKYPFIKVPVVENTYLWMQAKIGVDNENRMPTYTGNIAHGLFLNYKPFMVLHSTFYHELDRIVGILNRYYEYCINKIDPAMAIDTAYSLACGILPAKSNKNLAMRVLLRPVEVKEVMRDSRPLLDIPRIVLTPGGSLTEAALK